MESSEWLPRPGENSNSVFSLMHRLANQSIKLFYTGAAKDQAPKITSEGKVSTRETHHLARKIRFPHASQFQ